MKKTPNLFVRNPEDRRFVLDQVNPGCEWVMAGEGQATRKYDGTCVMLDDAGNWWARREVKPGKKRPDNFVECDADPVTNKVMGWIPMEESSYKAIHAEAVSLLHPTAPGTYELMGPRIGSNPEHLAQHLLLRHEDAEHIEVSDLSYQGLELLMVALHNDGCEGIVWHHPDGRMAKLRWYDFPSISRKS